MRAISLWQPWATAVAIGSKHIESRHWATSYRGPLAIHAAKRKHLGDMLELRSDPLWIGALDLAGWTTSLVMRTMRAEIDALPYGAFVGHCRLVDCVRVEDLPRTVYTHRRYPAVLATTQPNAFSWTEDDMCDFSDGRFGWILEDIVQLATPVPYRGAQGFFDVDESVLGLQPVRSLLI